MNWEIIPKITTGISFAAFSLAILAFILKSASQKKTKLISKIPEKDRLPALMEMADNLGISAKGIEDEKLVFKLVMEKLQTQASLRRTLYNLIFMVFLISSAVVVVQIVVEKKKITMSDPVKKIVDSTNNEKNETTAEKQEDIKNVKNESKKRQTTVIKESGTDNKTDNKETTTTSTQKRNEISSLEQNISNQILHGKKIKMYYTTETKLLCSQLQEKLEAAGAFTEAERLLVGQMSESNLIEFRIQRKVLAEQINRHFAPELSFNLDILENQSQYDFKIHLATR